MYSRELQQHVIFKEWPNARAYAFYNIQNYENLQPQVKTLYLFKIRSNIETLSIQF